MSRLPLCGIRIHAATDAARVLEKLGAKDAAEVRRADSRGASRAVAGLSDEELRRDDDQPGNDDECPDTDRLRAAQPPRGLRRSEDRHEVWLLRLPQPHDQGDWSGLP